LSTVTAEASSTSKENLTDARYFNALEEPWLGFSFDVLDASAVTVDKAKEILDWLFEPRCVASFGMHQTKEEIEFILEETSIPYVEVAWGHEWIQSNSNLENTLIRVHTNDFKEVQNSELKPAVWIVSLESFPDETLIHWINNEPVIIRIKPEKETLKQLLDACQPLGFEFAIEPEERPGWSAVDVYDEIIEAIEML